MLNPYAKGGQYERFFEGKNNVDFFQRLHRHRERGVEAPPDLHAVVNILLLHRITGEMYLTRNRRKVRRRRAEQQLGDIGADDPSRPP